MTIAAGELDQRVTIRRAADVPDGGGGFETSWSDLRTVWARVRSQSGREAVVAHALQGIAVFRIVMRWRGDVSTADQLVWRGRTLNIRTADDPDGLREQLVIIADTDAVEAG